jgi:hypothetical protein
MAEQQKKSADKPAAEKRPTAKEAKEAQEARAPEIPAESDPAPTEDETITKSEAAGLGEKIDSFNDDQYRVEQLTEQARDLLNCEGWVADVAIRTANPEGGPMTLAQARAAVDKYLNTKVEEA